MFLNPEIVGLSPAAILFAALIVDAVFGEFGPLFRVIPHPVAVIGGLVGWLDRRLNRERRSPAARRARGAVVVVLMVGLAAVIGWYLTVVAQMFPYGWALEL